VPLSIYSSNTCISVSQPRAQPPPNWPGPQYLIRKPYSDTKVRRSFFLIFIHRMEVQGSVGSFSKDWQQTLFLCLSSSYPKSPCPFHTPLWARPIIFRYFAFMVCLKVFVILGGYCRIEYFVKRQSWLTDTLMLKNDRMR
jgi:hypothetical protein